VVLGPPPAAGWELSQNCSTETVTVGDQDGELDPLAGVPFLIRTSVVCPKMDLDSMAARARARLDSITGKAVARELWTGEMTTAAPYQLPAAYTTWLNPAGTTDYTNPFLKQAGATDVGGTGLDALGALGAVEAEVGQRITSGPVVLHVPYSVINDAAWALERRGDLLYTMTGALVVADHGYPVDATPVVYGTGQVWTWVGGIEVESTPHEVVSKEDNTVRVWAGRPAMALFDPRTLVTCTVTG
jgi:hypothetical protein